MASSLSRKLLFQTGRNIHTAKDIFKTKTSINAVACIGIHSRQNEPQYNNEKCGLLVAALAGGFTAFMINEVRKNHVAHATNTDPTTPFMGSDKHPPSRPSRRAMFNFIADVVHISSPSVVHIERTVRYVSKLILMFVV